MSVLLPTTFTVESEEVLYTDRAITCVGGAFVTELKKRAMQTGRKRIRLCTHPHAGDLLHEMLIVLHRQTYVPPHSHPDKSESFHLIEGALDVVLFDEAGRPQSAIPMAHSSQAVFYYRLSDSRFHTVLPQSEWVVFHETTNGPFRPEQTVMAPWAPGNAADRADQQTYLRGVRQFLESYHATC
ncbi:MAG: cupin fold metalloprotein, WbuC family [Magnetococcales bacterium]|nr:cupin fold metalloprotein, WbuC family [Magnetococcales bacterium]